MSRATYSFDRSVAVITGAGKGIGRQIALDFAAAGARVVLVGRHLDTLNKVADEIGLSGGTSLVVPADITRVSDIKRIFAETVAAFGQVDILVNNSGVNRTGPSVDVTEETWDWIADTNVKGMFFCSTEAARLMIPRKAGKIINIGSIISHLGLGFNVPYASSKGAVLQMTKSLALEWARHGLNVNGIGPGYVLTDQVRWLFENETYRRNIMGKQPAGALPLEVDISDAALFLASESARFINGEMIYVDGASAAGWMGPE